MNMCQMAIHKSTNQTPDQTDQETKDDPPGSDVMQNPNLEMGFVNQAVSMEMDNDTGYTSLHRPSDGYQKLQKSKNSIIKTQDYDEYLAPKDVTQNSTLPMESINQAISMEMENYCRYTRLQKPYDGYEKLQKPQNPSRETQNYSEYMVPQDQSDVYEEIPDFERN